MSRLVIVVEKASDWGSFYPSENIVTAVDYLKQPLGGEGERTQVINLCRSYKYLGLGYYVSLLAEARGHKVIPSVRTINDLRRRSIYGVDIEDLNAKLAKFLPEGSRDATDFGLLVYFGQTNYAPLSDLARQVFETFPCPILRLEFERQKVWQIWAEMLWQVGYALCHQLPERSLFIGGYQLPVCARDTGTMLGFGLVLTYYLARKRWKRGRLPDVAVLVAAGIGFALFAFDGLSSYIGLRDTSNEIRLISGLGFGLSLGLMMLTVLSYVAKGDVERRTFDWRDLLILIPLLALLYFAATTDLGAVWYTLFRQL